MLFIKTGNLLNLYRANARTLPWRREPRNPYHVLVSEVMLQQTQVDRVVPRFESFIERFPTFEILARASEEEVLEEWSGLGYYRRARMLHSLANVVMERPGGLPRKASELVKLPGIGPYTAAAVASLFVQTISAEVARGVTGEDAVFNGEACMGVEEANGTTAA